MSNDKLKYSLRTKLERQKKALQDTQDQLDWVEQQERQNAPKGPTK